VYSDHRFETKIVQFETVVELQVYMSDLILRHISILMQQRKYRLWICFGLIIVTLFYGLLYSYFL